MIVTLAHGLGDRHEAGETIRRHTGEDVASLWTTWLDQSTPRITQPEAALVADRAFNALHNDESTPAVTELNIATRGATPPAHYLTLDATRLLGGNRQSGQPTDWKRFFAALQHVIATLDGLNRTPRIRVDLRCHLSAALATGRTLHQATRWAPTFATRHGDVAPATSEHGQRLDGDFDQYKESGDIIVDIDLLGHDVAAKTDELASRLPPASGRISLSRPDTNDLSPERIASLARWAARTIRSANATAPPRNDPLHPSSARSIRGPTRSPPDRNRSEPDLLRTRRRSLRPRACHPTDNPVGAEPPTTRGWCAFRPARSFRIRFIRYTNLDNRRAYSAGPGTQPYRHPLDMARVVDSDDQGDVSIAAL